VRGADFFAGMLPTAARWALAWEDRAGDGPAQFWGWDFGGVWDAGWEIAGGGAMATRFGVSGGGAPLHDADWNPSAGGFVGENLYG
jgi:hypothetical protein